MLRIITVYYNHVTDNILSLTVAKKPSSNVCLSFSNPLSLIALVIVRFGKLYLSHEHFTSSLVSTHVTNTIILINGKKLQTGSIGHNILIPDDAF